MAQIDPSGRWPAGRSAGSPRLGRVRSWWPRSCSLLAGMLVVAGLEATDPSTPVTLGPADVAASTALGEPDLLHDPRSRCRPRTRSTSATTTRTAPRMRARRPSSGITGSSIAMLGPASPCARCEPPEELFTFHGTGILIDEPRYPREVYAEYGDEASRAGLTIEPAVVLDTTNGLAGARTPISLDAPLPRTGTPVELTGARLGVVRRGLLARSERRQGVRLRRAGPVRGRSSSTAPPGTRSGCWFASTRSSSRRPR